MPTKRPRDRIIKCHEALREATDQAMAADSRVIVIGEGVPDPKGIFGTTLGLRAKYGANRVFDMPVSENALTGICIGAALRGLRPILTHQRADFSFLSFDQIINNAAKWHFMFGGQASVPLVIRMIIGHGWGQGPQHSQNLQSYFAHVPGLKVVAPSSAYDAKGLLLQSLADNNPVMFFEHRWVHLSRSHVPEKPYLLPLGQANVISQGRDVTLVASSYMTIEARRAVQVLREFGVAVELIDLRSIQPLDEKTIIKSAKKTGRLVVADWDWLNCGVGRDIVARVAEKSWNALKSAPIVVGWPEYSVPSAPSLTKNFFPTYQTIAEAVFKTLGKNDRELKRRWVVENKTRKTSHDVPDESFTGPF